MEIMSWSKYQDMYSYEWYRGVAVGVGLLAHLSDGLSAVLHQHTHQH